MKSITFALLLAVVGSARLSASATVDYCATSLCGTSDNIACNNNGAFASTCPSDRVMVTMTAALKTAIVRRHNLKRNAIASGRITGFKPAVRMATIRWNGELAKLAAFNAKRCVFAHDECRNTDQFHFSGQNIAKTWWSTGTRTDAGVILPQIDAWWSEIKDANMTYINAYPANPPAVVGHFTVITAEKNYAVGCAAIRYTDPDLNNWMSLSLVCNYARTNIIGKPMYTRGVATSKCKTGKNPNYPYLCSVKETYAVNVV